jgi:tetratricopeptide (TPR) repeat protein
MRHLIIIVLFGASTAYGQNPQYDSVKSIAQTHFETGDFKQAVAEYHTAFKIWGDKGYAHDRYNAAIANAAIGQIDSAFFHLFRLADKTKFLEYPVIINEKHFETLKSDRRWSALLLKLNPRNEKYNDSLAQVLSTIREKDQKYRHMLDAVRRPYGEEPSDSFKSILRTMAYTDSMNLILVSSIIDQFG